MVRWMCGVKLKDRLPSKELRERLGVDDIALVLQQNRLRWYGHVLQKDEDDWVKKCMEYDVEGSRPRGRPKKTWKEVVHEDCHARKLNKEDAMDCCKWRKVIKEERWSGWVWVGECFFWYRPTRVVPDRRPLNCHCWCCVSKGAPGQLIWHRRWSDSLQCMCYWTHQHYTYDSNVNKNVNFELTLRAGTMQPRLGLRQRGIQHFNR